MRLDEARYVLAEARSRIKVGRSSSNPGYLSVELPSRDAYEAAMRVFPEMAGNDWLANSTDSLGYLASKEGEAYWVVWVWWEDKRGGLTLYIRDDYRGLNVRVEPKVRTLREETHAYGDIGRARLDPKTYAIRSVQAYLRGVQDGTNGTDRAFERTKRAPMQAGGAAQTKAVERVQALAAAAGREAKVKEADARGDVRVSVMPDFSNSLQNLLVVWVGKRGNVQVSLGDGIIKGRSAWPAIERELRSHR